MTMQTENVWEYPRPAICEPFPGNLRIVHGGQVLAETTRGFRTLETSHPPTYYFPPDAVDLSQLHNSEHRTFCEWKGAASYFDLEGASGIVANVGWTYRRPSQLFEPITDYLSFYASRVDACFVEGEQVQAQAGDFYGGWITSNLVGPFKGVPGSRGW